MESEDTLSEKEETEHQLWDGGGNLQALSIGFPEP